MRNRIFILCIVFSLTAVISAQESNVPAKEANIKTGKMSNNEKKEITSQSVNKESEMAQKEEKPDSLDPLKYSRPSYDYNSEGKRDPFDSLAPVQVKEDKKIKGLFNYDKAVLQGVVNTDSSRYALALDGDKFAHILREGDKVLGGVVTEITDDSVFLHIVKYGRAMTIIMRLETAKSTRVTREAQDVVFRKPGINLSYEMDSATAKNISVEEVVVPSLRTKTVEEIWFGQETNKAGDTITKGENTLFDPPDNSSIGLPHLFRWTKSPDDSLYTFVISGDSNFSNTLFTKEELRTSSFLLQETALLSEGTLYWKIIAKHKSGKTVNSRNILSFRITDTSYRGNDNEKK
jgi:hypothetical protein